MRVLHAAAVGATALLLASTASAQGLGDVAAREKAKKKSTTPTKVYTENDLGQAAGPSTLSTPEGQTTSPAPGAPAAAAGEKKAEGEAKEKTPDELQAEAQEAWRKKLAEAREEETFYRDLVDKIQLDVNDTSGGVFTPRRASLIQRLEDNKKKLAEVQARIASLENEGRLNFYR
jgi:hypothetical protein